jgi:outer membrane autotransporter protein
MAAHLDAGFTKDMSPAMSRVYGRLAGQSDVQLQGTMDALGNEAVQSVGIARMAASQDFVERMNSCPQFGAGGLQLQEQDCVWSRAVGDRAQHNGSSTTVGYQSDMSKVQIGGQKGIGDGWFVGGSFGYDHSSLSASQTSVNGGGWTGALIAKKQLGDWIFSGAIDAGTGRYDSTRQVALGDTAATATASLTESHVGLHGRVARQFAMDGWYLKPYVDVHAIHLHTGAYDETGAGVLNLQMQAANGMSYAVSPMLEAGSLFNLDNGLALRGYVSAGLAFSSQRDWGASGRLQGSVSTAGTFTTTSELGSRRAKLNVGVDLIASKNLDVRVEYSGEFARGFHSNGAMLKAAYSF